MITSKIAIITGGNRGLGRNTAINLAQRGVDILFTYCSNQKEAESLIRECETMGRKAAAYCMNTGGLDWQVLAPRKQCVRRWRMIRA